MNILHNLVYLGGPLFLYRVFILCACPENFYNPYLFYCLEAMFSTNFNIKIYSNCKSVGSSHLSRRLTPISVLFQIYISVLLQTVFIP